VAGSLVAGSLVAGSLVAGSLSVGVAAGLVDADVSAVEVVSVEDAPEQAVTARRASTQTAMARDCPDMVHLVDDVGGDAKS
jgi:hypothetical protein